MSNGTLGADAARLAETLTALSDAEGIAFPDVIRRMTEGGLERYHADLVRDAKTYYDSEGRWVDVPAKPLAGRVAPDFSATAVESAVRASQSGEIGYGEFCRRVAAAGCAGYYVTLSGRRVTYYGRSGESHVELFPTAP